MKSLFVAVAVVLGLVVMRGGASSMRAAEGPPEAEARAALQKWMTASSKVKSVTAEFDQLRNLKNVRRPLRKEGKIWMVKEGGKLRWQIGEPPTMMVLRGADGGMTVLDVPDKKARMWSRESLMEQEKAGKGQGFSSMMEAMQTPSLEEFEKRFTLEKWRVDPANPAFWEFDLSFKDRRTSLVVMQLRLAVNTADGALRSMTLNMRDGSAMTTQMRSYILNQTIPASTFQVSLEGYKVEQE